MKAIQHSAMDTVKTPEEVDYCISSVLYDKSGSQILKAKVHIMEAGIICDAKIWTRKNILHAMEDHKAFTTVMKSTSAFYMDTGKEISLVTVNRIKYIRTDQLSYASDILESLPEFD